MASGTSVGSAPVSPARRAFDSAGRVASVHLNVRPVRPVSGLVVHSVGSLAAAKWSEKAEKVTRACLPGCTGGCVPSKAGSPCAFLGTASEPSGPCVSTMAAQTDRGGAGASVPESATVAVGRSGSSLCTTSCPAKVARAVEGSKRMCRACPLPGPMGKSLAPIGSTAPNEASPSTESEAILTGSSPALKSVTVGQAGSSR